MPEFVEKTGIDFFCAGEKLAWRQGDAIRDWTVERLRTCVVNLGRVRHSGDDPLGRFDRIVLVRFGLRQFVEYRLRQFALFEVETAIISKKEAAAILLVVSFGVEDFAA